MPLRLKSLELHGYKTFAAKTSFEFAEGITAIVGPNGSGKSNIADAIRWVLGEQTYSILRAKKTEDMIFAGSEQRPRAGMASAAVTFDNSNNWLPVDFSEVALARRAYRDGRNEYLLNSQQVRLKDINELLAQSGLSERTYTILGQGLVDASLALKADERRRLFEEAAGIGLYRSRREEALRRLETTRRNLDRVLDILAELEPRLRSLERQAARAVEFDRVQADLRILLRDWYGYHWHLAQRELAETLDLAHSHEVRLSEVREAYQGVRQNFASFRDHLNSLRSRLNSWHRQSSQLHEQREKVSSEAAVLDERQRSLLENRQAAQTEQSRLAEETRIAAERLDEAAKEFTRFQAEFDEARQKVQNAQSDLAQRQGERAQAEGELEAARKRMDEWAAGAAQLQARLDELAARAATQDQKLESAGQAIRAADAELKAAEADVKRAGSERQQAEAVLQKTEDGLQAARKHLAELENERKETQTALSGKETDRARIQAQKDVLEQAEQSLAGYADGARLLLDAARQSRLKGARGALSSVLDVPADLELAVAAALGEYTDAVVLASGGETEEALALLGGDQPSRASILPLDWLNPPEPVKAPRDADCLGVAADLVKVNAELRPAVDLLLGQVLVVRDRKAARRMLSGLPASVKAVTPEGEVFHASGQVLGGKPRTGALGRQRQRREYQAALEKAEKEIAGLEAAVKKLAGRIEASQRDVSAREESLKEQRAALDAARELEGETRVRLEAAQRQRDWQVGQEQQLQEEIRLADIEREETTQKLASNQAEMENGKELVREKSGEVARLSLEELQEQVQFWTTRAAVSEQVLDDARGRREERGRTAADMHTQAASLADRLAEIDRSLEQLEADRIALRGNISNFNSQLEELDRLIGPAEKELESGEIQEAELQKQETEGQMNLARVERSFNQIQLDLGRKQEALDGLRHKIEDDFGLVAFEYSKDVSGPVPLPFEGLVEQLPAVAELPPDLEENLTRQRSLVRRMGPVNPEAQQEFVSVKERHAFLTGQLDDLHKAENDLRQVIAELDELTRREFEKTFEAVAQEFHTIFHRLFGGGAAKLVLTDPENLTETGIDIEARLPGRREQGLSLLSGGERSLTAIALVFSLLRISPTPVCVMDEVDAMLDEANVGRFRDLLLELSKQTQFVIITHNRNTVQAADVIYGVTMGRDSASQVISLKLDEVSEEYLK